MEAGRTRARASQAEERNRDKSWCMISASEGGFLSIHLFQEVIIKEEP